MQQLTQTGRNCLQTCLAMLLDCDVAQLPDQHKLPSYEEYSWALRSFFYKHYGLAYVEEVPEHLPEITQRRAYHVMIGESVRSSPENDIWHATVGLGGELFWDVHPSRAGLTRVIRWATLVPFPEHWRAEWEKRKVAGDSRLKCVCPACAEEVADAA